MSHTPPEAPLESVPPLLVEPPWSEGAPRDTEPVVLKGLKAPRVATTVHWAPGQREEWLAKGRADYPPLGDTDWDAAAASFADGTIQQGERLRRRQSAFDILLHGPEEHGRALLADERYHADLSGTFALRGIVARYELDALPLVLHQDNLWALYPFFDAHIAQLCLKHKDNSYSHPAKDWFVQHGPAAIALIVPDLVRRPGPKRERAEVHVRSVADAHGGEAVLEAVRPYGEEVVRAVASLGIDPLDRYPSPLPEIGFDVAALPPVLLAGRESALPEAAVRNLVTMFLISTPEKPYAGVERVVKACDPESLAEFAWALYEADDTRPRWTSPGVEYALRLLGDDRTAARLGPIVARWDKGTSWYNGGSSALGVFTSIGTDGALRQLHRLAQKAKDQRRIRRHSQSLIDGIAQRRGLDAEQLADLLVPDLGLDASGGLTLDYGPRRFTVGFDEHLKPFVAGEDGKRRKTLPKPGVRDDAALAPAAHQRFTELKKEARTVAAEQIKRLEAAMVKGRRWTPEEFRALFLAHPLMWHIARRLVWRSGEVEFRVAEDRSLADVRDDAVEISAPVELPHPLRLTAPDAWAEVFADYEILQPFPQLGRPVHALTAKERDAARLERFEGASVHFGAILGLVDRGWKLGPKETGGFHRHVSRELAENSHLVIELDPGVRAVAPDEYAEQELRVVALARTSYGQGERLLADLDEVTASELLAELTRLTGAPGS
ncbi:DUF4132 domain-containing protein [Actinomadura litoris]|uniref:DUF4132 domain-containing protein n=1 Tax=Actinomadura litoris TaxID=2678616 RepID=A0A7K1L831_9ACTN|nr:DUF4132 domain-containing protein [Actinomadura litoris]MUN40578.1 DUF4132 domain-containing protein [Actinomadura litoris]